MTITKTEMILALGQFVEMYNGKLTDLKIETYWKVLKQLRPDQLDRAVNRILAEHERGMPSASVIIKASELRPEDEAEIDQKKWIGHDKGMVFHEDIPAEAKEAMDKFMNKEFTGYKKPGGGE